MAGAVSLFWKNPVGYVNWLRGIGNPFAYAGMMLRESNNFWAGKFARNFIFWGVLLLARLSVWADQSVTLTWNPSPDTNVLGYKVYYGSASRTYTNSIILGNVTNLTVSGLTEGVTYYFSATTLDAAEVESDFSNEAIYAIPQAVASTPPLVWNLPTLDALTNLTIYQNAGLQTVHLGGITSGASSGNPTLTVSAVSSNTGIITAPTVSYSSPNASGSLQFAPVANGLGTATLTVTVNDGGPTNNLISRAFTVTVMAAPAAPVASKLPSLNAIANVTLPQNAAVQTITLTGITPGAMAARQILKVTASSSNPGLVPMPVIRYTSPASTAQLVFKPLMNASGVAVITVTINNGAKSNNIAYQTFKVTVLPNQPPTLNPIGNVTVARNAVAQTIILTGITSGSTSENQTLTVTASSSCPRLVPTPMIHYSSPASTATLTFRPVPNATGVATITVTINDGANNNNIMRQTFTVTVTASSLSINSIAKTSVSASAVGPVNPLANSNPAATLATVASAQGQFSFQVTGLSGGKYVVQATSDLVHWTSVQTNTAPFVFQDSTTAGTSQRFYRTLYLP